MMIQSASQLTERERDFIKAFIPPFSGSTKWLAERINSSVNHISGIAKRLLKYGLIEREKNWGNMYHYELTKAGLKIYNQLMGVEGDKR